MSDFFIDIFFFVFFIWSHFYNDCIRFSGFVQKTISRFARNTQDSLNYSRKLKNLGIPIIFDGITDETKDPVPGLSFYVRKDGHITGEMSEGATELPIILDRAMNKSDAEIDAAVQRWIDFCISVGVTAVFDAGIPGYPEFHEHVYSRLRALDEQGKLPIYVDGCYVISAAWEAEEGIRQLKRMQKEYNTEHLKVHTLKLFMDGTLKLHSGAMVTPYADTGEPGCNAMNLEELVALLKELNKEGLDFHTHTVGEASSRLVLDAVEQVRKELGDDFRIRALRLWE